MTLYDLLNIVLQCLTFPLKWFVDILTESDALNLYLALFSVYMVITRLVKPMLGSDRSGNAGDD